MDVGQKEFSDDPNPLGKIGVLDLGVRSPSIFHVFFREFVKGKERDR